MGVTSMVMGGCASGAADTKCCLCIAHPLHHLATHHTQGQDAVNHAPGHSDFYCMVLNFPNMFSKLYKQYYSHCFEILHTQESSLLFPDRFYQQGKYCSCFSIPTFRNTVYTMQLNTTIWYRTFILSKPSS